MPELGRLHWGAESLWRRLEPLLPGLSVEVLASVDSTNTRLLERARRAAGERDGRITRPGDLDGHVPEPRSAKGRRAGDVQPCLLVAEQQTRGRGRLGRDWHATAGDSLSFSLALPLAPHSWSGLSLAVGLSLAEALEPLPDEADSTAAAVANVPPRIGLKWPNDLWLWEGAGRGRKLGGILIETVNVGARRLCVVGVGLNIAPQPDEGPSAGSACLQELQPGASAPLALATIAEPLVRGLLTFERDGFAPLAAAYARRDLLAGQPVTTLPGTGGAGAGALVGVAEGVDAQGALRLRAGELHHVVSGEVSVRLQTAPPARDAGATTC